MSVPLAQRDPRIHKRQRTARVAAWALLGITLTAVLILVVLLTTLFVQGAAGLSWRFLTSKPSVLHPDQAGIWPALMGSLRLIVATIALAVPVGVGAAIYLEEYPRKGKLATIIEVNIANLAGVPSIVYGMLGLAMFVRWMALQRSVLAGASTMALLLLPMIIIATREALRAVPQSIRQAAFALGASRWQTIRHHVLPAAFPGILTGVILSVSRAIGETAPLIVIGATTFVTFAPRGWLDQFTVLPIQIYNWARESRPEFHQLAAAGILVLLAALLTLNGVAIWLRHRAGRNIQW